MRVGDTYRWIAESGGLWVRDGIYTITEVDPVLQVVRITAETGTISINFFELEEGQEVWVPHNTADDVEKYVGVVVRPDGQMCVYLGHHPQDDRNEVIVFPNEATAIEVMSITSALWQENDYYLIPVRAVRHIRNGEVQNAV